MGQSDWVGLLRCRILEAMASIRRTSQDFNYQLVINRVFADGEEDTLDPEDESKHSEFCCFAIPSIYQS